MGRSRPGGRGGGAARQGWRGDRDHAAPFCVIASVRRGLRPRWRRAGIALADDARLLEVAPVRWVVKGGVALVLRPGDHALTATSHDPDCHHSLERAQGDPLPAATTDLGAVFVVAIVPVNDPNLDGAAVRFRVIVIAGVSGCPFDSAGVHIGVDDPLPLDPNCPPGPGLLGCAGLSRLATPSSPRTRRIAEKLHADSRTHAGDRAGTRVNDLIDRNPILSFACFGTERLRPAMRETLRHRGAHDVPAALASPPRAWPGPERRIARKLGSSPDLETGHHLAATFLDPVSAARWVTVRVGIRPGAAGSSRPSAIGREMRCPGLGSRRGHDGQQQEDRGFAVGATAGSPR